MGKETTMQMWADAQLSLVRARMLARESEASRARLVALDPRVGATMGLRGTVGRALIRAGQALAPERTATHSHYRRVAARQP